LYIQFFPPALFRIYEQKWESVGGDNCIYKQKSESVGGENCIYKPKSESVGGENCILVYEQKWETVGGKNCVQKEKWESVGGIIESWYKTNIPYLTSVLKGITTIHPYLLEYTV
jgi:hypothetical protein